MKHNQIFVRVGIPYNKSKLWVNADVLDLDEESFHAFTAEMLHRAGIVVGIREDAVDGDKIEYKVKPELEEKYIKEKLEEDN